MLIKDIIPSLARRSYSASRPKIKMRKQTSKKALAFFTILFLILQFFAGLGFLFPKQAKADVGRTYYVSVADGNDTYNGLEKTHTTGNTGPWQTIAKVNALACGSGTGQLNAGDTVEFKSGETWREQLTVPCSGTAGNPITFGAYGTTGDKPKITASALLSSWTAGTAREDFTMGTPIANHWWLMEDASTAAADGNASDAVNPTWTGTVAQSSTHKQGSYGTSLAAGTGNKLTRINSALGTNFPGKMTTTAFTLTFWVNFASAPTTAYQEFITLSDGSTNGFRVWLDTNKLIIVRIYKSSGVYATARTNSAAVSGWQHIAVRWDGTDVAIFNNGTKQTTHEALDAMGSNTTSYFNILSSPDCVTIYDEVGIFSSALTDDQITSIYTYGLQGERDTATSYWAKVAVQPEVVTSDDTWLISQTTLAALSNSNSFWADATDGRVYVGTDVNPSSHTINSANANDIITANSKTFFTIDGLELNTSNRRAVTLTDSTDVTVKNCTIKNTAHSGIWMSITTASGTELIENNDISEWALHRDGTSESAVYTIAGKATAQAITIRNNNIHNAINVGVGSPYNGISARSGTFLIENNTITKSSHGVRLGVDASGSIVRYNKIFDTDDDAIWIEAQSSGTGTHSIYYNLLYNGQGECGDFSSSANFYNNVCYGYSGDTGNGLKLKLGDYVLKNNIIVGNAASQLFTVSTVGTVTVANNAFGPEGTAFIAWRDVAKNTYAAFETVYGGTTDSIQTDPLFTNAAGNDFTLKSTSPAINAGTNLGATYDDAIMPGSTWPSLVTTADQDLRGSGWEIGAYVYPVPQAPTVGAPSALSFSSIRWNFTDNSNDETGFRLYGSTGTVLAQSPLANLSYLDETGLSAGTQYSGRYVKAYNSYGESVASDVVSSITTPGVPGGGSLGLIGTSPATTNLIPPTATTPNPNYSSDSSFFRTLFSVKHSNNPNNLPPSSPKLSNTAPVAIKSSCFKTRSNSLASSLNQSNPTAVSALPPGNQLKDSNANTILSVPEMNALPAMAKLDPRPDKR